MPVTALASAGPTRWRPWLTAPRLAAALAGLSAVCAVAAVSVHLRLDGAVRGQVHLAASDVVLAIAFPAVACLIIASQRRNVVGWALLTTAFMGPYLLAGQYAAASWSEAGHSTLERGAAWVSIWGYVPYLIVWGLVAMHAPDGQLPSPRWRRVRSGIVLLIVVETVARMFAPVNSDTDAGIANPLAVHAQALNVITLVASVGVILGGGACGVVAVWVRLRRAAGRERSQLQWLALGVAGLLLAAAAGVVTAGATSDAAFAAGMVFLVATIAIGVVRHQLFDIGVALSRTVAYGLISVLLLVAYAATVAGATAVQPGRRTTYALIAIVALVAAAARDQVQRLVDRLLFGERRDPYAVLRRMRATIDVATGPVDALFQLCEGLRNVLKLPYVAVEAHDERIPVIAAGATPAATYRVAACDRGEEVGALVVGHRTRGERVGADERAVFEDVARQAGALLVSASTLHELHRSRERIVMAREEERRRLHRDLHDTIGPELAAVAMQLDSLAERVAAHDEQLAGRTAVLGGHLRATVKSIRHVVDDLRPPALDDLGLAPALRQLLSAFGPAVHVTAGALPELPAATEVAAYRIAAEAVNNAMRHAACSTCTVELRLRDGELEVKVRDDGSGIADGTVPGVGLRSMSERASEVGGRLSISSGEGAGTTVRASLPLDSPR